MTAPTAPGSSGADAALVAASAPTETALEVAPGSGASAEVATADAQAHAAKLGLTQGATRRLLERGATISRYVILSRIGGGGMGEVYAAYDPELDRKVAVKLLREVSADQGRRDRLLREAQAMAQLAHPNVIAVHDVGTHGDEIFVAMEFVSGGTLGDWMKQPAAGLFHPWREALRRFIPAAEGLAAAHAAGIVHRDFKPDNVLCGSDGRVRVADFGLARHAAPSVAEAMMAMPVAEEALDRADAPVSGRQMLQTPLTQVGAVLGTPAFMAPEQHQGRLADARSDQFSFCVALYLALYGALPYAGRTLREYQDALAKERVEAPVASARVPMWIRRILIRGLRANPADRFGDMRELIVALGDDPVVRRRPWLITAAVVLTLGAVALVWQRVDAARSMVCKGAERKLGGVWDDRLRADMSRAFLATGTPFAQSAAAGVERALGEYARGLTAMRQEACEATRVRGEASEEVLDLRMQCLSRRSKSLRALGVLFTQTDAEIVLRAVNAATSLPPLSGCADLEQLALGERVPPDPQLQRAVDELRTRLADGDALFEAGKYAAAKPLADALMQEARRLAYAPVRAEAALLQAQVRERQDDLAGAAASLHEAARAAEKGRVDALTARAWSRLVHVIGTRRAKPDDGHEWARYADSAVERLGGDDELSGSIANYEAGVLALEGKRPEAAATYTRALELRTRALGKDHPLVAHTHSNLGLVYRAMGRNDESLLHLRAAVDIGKSRFGPDHPDVATSMMNLASLHIVRGEDALARPLSEEALRILAAALGAEHADVAAAQTNIGLLYETAGDYGRARAHHERALAIRRKTLGPAHPSVFASHNNLGSIASAEGKHAEALAQFQQALAGYLKGGDASAADVTATMENVAREHLWLGDFRAARQVFERALPLAEQAGAEGQPQLGTVLSGLGESVARTGEVEPGVRLIRRAIALLEKGGEATDLAEARFALADVLPRSAASDARRLAALARAAYAAAGRRYARELRRVESWLKNHP